MREQSKKNVGRPALPVKRETPIGVRLTPAERFIILQKAERAGMTLTAYIRQMAIQGKVIARLSDEDRQTLRKLIEMNNEIYKLVELADKEGMLKAIFQFEGLRKRIDDIIDQFKP